MLILRSSLAALMVVALVGLTQAASTQKEDGSKAAQGGAKACDGQEVCDKCVKGPEQEGCKDCELQCDTAKVTVRVYGCKCITVCLLGPPSRGLGSTMRSRRYARKNGCCDDKGGDACGCGKGEAGKGDGKDGGAKDCSALERAQGKCDCCDKYGCDKCRECRSRTKKHLLVKDITIECPIAKCVAVDAKATCGACEEAKAAPAQKGAKAAPAKDLPSDPPPVQIGQVSPQILRTSHVAASTKVELLGSLFK